MSLVTEIFAGDFLGFLLTLFLYLLLMVSILGTRTGTDENIPDKTLARFTAALYQKRKRLMAALGLGKIAHRYSDALQDLNKRTRNRYSWGG